MSKASWRRATAYFVAALEQHAQALDERRGPFGEVGQGAFVDLAGVAEGLAQEHGGGRVAVGDAFDVHGY